MIIIIIIIIIKFLSYFFLFFLLFLLLNISGCLPNSVCTIYSINKYLDIFARSRVYVCRSQWQRGLRRRSATARLLRLWVRIPPVAWMFVCCECCVLSGRGLCDGLIIRPEESNRMWCVVVCDLENLMNEEAMVRVGP